MRAALLETIPANRSSDIPRSATNFVHATASRVSIPLCPPAAVSIVVP